MTDIPPGRLLEAALDEALADLMAELSELHGALPAINDPKLHDRVAALVALAPRIDAAYGTSPGPGFADTLLGLRAATVALPVPARDPDLGATPTLQLVRQAKGLIIAAAEDALKAAAALGWEAPGETIPRDPALEVSREERATEIEILTGRLDKVALGLDALDAAALEPTDFPQQQSLLRAYVPPMRVEVDLARLHLTIGERTVDLGALAHAIEAMGELTSGFTATVTAWAKRVSESVSKGSAAIRQSVTEPVTGIQTIVRMVLTEQAEKRLFPFPVPEMVLIPPGEFMMGIPTEESRREKATDDSARPVHKVSIARPFWMGKNPVTRGEYAAFVEDTGYDADGGQWRRTRFEQTDRDPVVNVRVADAEAYAEWLSRKTGRSYRLPSEAEWEYAARAGTLTARYWGDGFDDAPRYAHIRGGGTVTVGEREPNAFGLYDMLGNVWEWTADIWHTDYRGAPEDGSAWTTGNSGRCVLRGGSWGNSPRDVRAGVRGNYVRGDRDYGAGFRLSRTSF